MTKYSQFEQNNGVSDVLFNVIEGRNTVKGIMKILGQPQSTVSSKLQFLRKNNIVIKDKWKYEPNWRELNRIFLEEVRRQMGEWMKDRKQINRFIKLFNEERIKSIIRAYSVPFVLNKDMRSEASMQNIVSDYFYGMSEMEDKDLKKIDESFVELKSLFVVNGSERFLFINSEYNLNKNMKNKR
jgi:predicted transcriptional regulator